MTISKKENGRVTLAVLEQKFKDYSKHNDEAHKDLKSDLKEIKNILMNGSNKIADNRYLIKSHLERHNEKEESKASLWVKAGIMGGIFGTLASILKGLFFG